MAKRRPPTSAWGRCWQGIRQSFATHPKPHRLRRRAGTGVEVLESRQVMDGAGIPALFLDGAEGEPGSQVANFALVDVNASSPKFNQTVSPGDYLQHATAWYFGHST